MRLADLRRRQGRTEEATALLAEAHEHRLAPLVTGWIALDEGNAERAAGEAERFLRRVGRSDRFERVAALELLVGASLALDRVDEAEEAAAELEAIAAEVGTPPLDAAALLARGRVAAAKGSAEALPALEDAADLFRESGVLYDAAQAELELARFLRGLGRDEEAEQVEQRGRAALRGLGVPVPDPTPPRNDLLTRREQEVLRLLASGRSNEEIAADLVLSVRTVETHVAHVYAKIGVSGRSARAAATAYALAHGLAEVQYR